MSVFIEKKKKYSANTVCIDPESILKLLSIFFPLGWRGRSSLARGHGAGPQHSAAAKSQQIFLRDELCHEKQGLKYTDDQILPDGAGENQGWMVAPPHPPQRRAPR